MELYTPVLALGLLAAGFAIFSVVMSAVVGPKRYNRAKLDSYECGIEPTPQPVGGGRFPVIHATRVFQGRLVRIIRVRALVWLQSAFLEFDLLRGNHWWNDIIY